MGAERSEVVRYGILGPLAVTSASGPLRIGSALQRLLLAVLLVDANQPVSARRLAEELWGDALPHDPAGALRTQVSRVRKILRPGALATEPTGYRLCVAPGELDADRFEELVVGAASAEEPHPLRLLEEALELWRGPALDGFADRPFAQPQATRLEELHSAAIERRAELLLDAGRLTQATSSIAGLLAEQPEREHARAIHMSALYLEGRHTEALEVYQSWRAHLAEERGLEPSPSLQRLEVEILQHTIAGSERLAVRVPWTAEVPRPVSRFFGREDDLEKASRLLGDVRLLTLWGPGGVGKTRLALEMAARAADRYIDGVHICDLAVIERTADVTRAVATGLGLRDKAFQSLEALLPQHLAGRRVLIVLDNCEHVLGGAARLAERIIGLTNGVDVLATSRERLAVDGEHIWEVKPLGASGTDSPAVGMFLDRARATNSEFDPTGVDVEVVADICRELDGLPLAIELAAARVRGLSLAQLHQGLDQRFEILAGGAGRPARHRSLAAVLDWSYAQLSRSEQKVFDRLAVFCGPFDVEAARAVATGDGIEPDTVTAAVLRLLDCALLVEQPGSGPRRLLCLDTMRRFGIGRLEASDEVTPARHRHAQWAVQLAERAERGLRGPDEARWAADLRHYLDELRAAHAWLVANDTDADVRLAAALRTYGLWRGTSEVFRWAEVAVAAAAGGAHPPRLAEALLATSTGAWQRGDLDGAVAAARMIGDDPALRDPASTRASLEARADIALVVGDLEAATTLFTDAHTLACNAGDLLQGVWDLGSASLSIAYGGDTREAYELASEVFAMAERCGSPSARAFAHFVMGEILANGEPVAAERHLLAAIDLAETSDARFVVGLANVAYAASKVRQQDVAGALAYCEAAITEWSGTGAWTPLWVTLRTVIELLARLEAYEDATILYGAVGSARGGAPLFGVDATMIRRAGERLRSRLGHDAFERSAREGAEMAEDDVLALALGALRRAAVKFAAQVSGE